ncbi:conserved phage C-terminal domain-containing protein [Enterobacter asburiae]|uniref:conserved phage C-terminal domain-containing protein n=1 Tax=Enterobacter asburiae TaxID=61645 RepID=UPI003BE92AEB
MNPSDIIRGFGRPVAYYPSLAKHLGGVSSTVLFCQMTYWMDKLTSDLGVHKTSDEIREETGLSYEEQLTARKKLKRLGVLVETNKRLEHRIYFKINFHRVDEILTQVIDKSPNWQNPFRETGKVQSGKPGMPSSRQRDPRLRDDGKTHFDPTEITTETTAEITDKDSCQVAPDDSADPAELVLTYFNRATRSSYRDGKTTMGYIRGRLSDMYSADDLILVTDYATAKWLNDPKMCDYLRPKTLFGPENFQEYHQKALKWHESGRPQCVNGRWMLPGRDVNCIPRPDNSIPAGFRG